MNTHNRRGEIEILAKCKYNNNNKKKNIVVGKLVVA